MRRATFLWVLASGLGLLAFQPAFRSDTRLVQINVVVRNKSGSVPNLTRRIEGTAVDMQSPPSSAPRTCLGRGERDGN